ncbi:hypothetical protein [Nocardia brasiliensis]|uniref:hypothetical protein n=2 Tax=Nocardia brasiliensis TaxID=37326 RepID=UPI001F2159AE|nr:hypothetical protein [Nocardia brasiliensis]
MRDSGGAANDENGTEGVRTEHSDERKIRMGKNAWIGVQVVGMVVLVASAQAVIRLLIDHRKSQLWGLFDWVPGGWLGELAGLVVLATLGAVLAGRANDKVKVLEG